MKAKPPSGSSKKAKPPVSQESFGLPGKTYKTPANAVKTTSLPKQNKTKPLAGMQGPSNFKNRSNKEVINAALMVTGVASASKSLAAKTVKILVPKTIGNKLNIRDAQRQYEQSLVTEKVLYQSKIPNLRFQSGLPNRFSKP